LAKRKDRLKGWEQLSLILLLLIFLVVVIRPLFQAPPGEDWDKEYSFPPPLETAPFPLKVYNHREKVLLEMDLEEYLVGVVAAEMPASFHPEALRAQAVAARTYTLKKTLEGGGCNSVPGAHICTDHTHCQAWVPDEKISGHQGEVPNIQRIRAAVSSTAGLVMTYNGTLIDAVYHSTCGGHTAAAQHVWVGSAPYLEGAECGFCEHSPWYMTTKEVTFSRFRQAFSEKEALPVLTSQGVPRIQVQEESSTGRIKTLQVGEKSYSAWQFRQKLDLPSSWLTYSFHGEAIRFQLQGYGHGVGLCQYGADGMGKAGWTFDQILMRYYQGIKVEQIRKALDA
jgi:stage II sporulation protein D